MIDLMGGLSERGIPCDMLCAAVGDDCGELKVNEHASIFRVPAWGKLAATMISPSMVSTLERICRQYDIIHVHHPDPMACLALYLSSYSGRVVLHWHSDIAKQRILLQF